MEQEKKIGSAVEEIEHLKRRIAELEKTSSDKGKEGIIMEALKEHAEKAPEKFLSENYLMAQEKIKEHAERISGSTSGETEKQHDEQIRELIQIAHDKGILNAVSIAKQLDPHFEDDFHKALINYMQSARNV